MARQVQTMVRVILHNSYLTATSNKVEDKFGTVHAMKAWGGGGAEVWLRSFLTSIKDSGEWVGFTPRLLYSRYQLLYDAGWNPRDSLDPWKKDKILLPLLESSHESPAVRRVSHKLIH